MSLEMDLIAAQNALVAMNLRKAIKDEAAKRASIVPSALLRKAGVPMVSDSEFVKVRRPHKVHNKTLGKFRVIDDDGHQYGEHDNEADADAQLAALLRKGDSPGHEFHGNQYTGGSGKDDNSSTQPAFQNPADAKAYHQKAAAAHVVQTERAVVAGNREKAAAHTAAAKAHLDAKNWVHPGKSMGEQSSHYDTHAQIAHSKGFKAWNT